MPESSVAEQIFRIVAEEFGLSPGSVSSTTTASDVDGWDSLRHATLLIAVERRFRFEFSGRDVADLESLGDLVAAVEAKLAA